MTINALFYNINEEIIEDWTGYGLHDLKNKIARTPLRPLETLYDDPLRTLRILRFASRFSLSITEELSKAILDSKVKTAMKEKISRERIGKEYSLMLHGNNPLGAISLLDHYKYLEIIFNLPQFRLDKDYMTKLQRILHPQNPLEIYTTVLLWEHRNDMIPLPKPRMLAKQICDHSLKLSKKESSTICSYLQHIDTMSSLCDHFDPIKAGTLLLSLQSHWESLLSLFPPSQASSLHSQIHSAGLQSFWTERPLLSVTPK